MLSLGIWMVIGLNKDGMMLQSKLEALLFGRGFSNGLLNCINAQANKIYA